MHDLGLASEREPDLSRGLGRGRGSHSEERRAAELFEASTDEEVIRPEVVPPHADAVHLVDDDEPDPDVAQHLDEARLPKALGRGVDEAGLSGGDPFEPRGALLRAQATSSRTSPSRRSVGGSLSTWSFISAMSGDSTSVGSGRSIAASWYVRDLPDPVGMSASVSRPSIGGAHDVLLAGTERLEAEELAEWGGEVRQAGEYRERVERRSDNSAQTCYVGRVRAGRLCAARAGAPGSRPRAGAGPRRACSARSSRDRHARASPGPSGDRLHPRGGASRRSGEAGGGGRAPARARPCRRDGGG